MLSTDLLDRQLLDALPATIYTLDLDGRLLNVHQHTARMGDESASQSSHPPEGVGKPIWESAGTDFSRAQVEHAIRHLRAGRAPVVRWEVVRPASDRGILLAQATPLHDESRAVTGFVVVTTDITSSVRTRDASIDAALSLSRSIDLDRIYQDTAFELRQTLRPDLVVIAVADDETSTPRAVYESGADSDRRALELRFANAWQSAIRDARVVSASADGTVEIHAPLTGTTGVLGAITIVMDDVESPERLAESERFLTILATQMTTAIERSRYIAQAAHRQRVEAIGEVAAGVAHELRNPIFGISSAAQLLRFRAREDPVMEKNVGRILREVERLNRMVATLLELGRPVALKLSRSDPDSVWDDLLESERGRLESRVLAVRRTRPDVPVSIPIDGEQLAQAFRNVLTNAVDAAPEASDITLQSVALANGGWRCRLVNTGEPIAPEMLARVFEPFFSTKPGGTGVGLALARRVIDEHHGTITIESSADAGTGVTITLTGTRTASLP